MAGLFSWSFCHRNNINPDQPGLIFDHSNILFKHIQVLIDLTAVDCFFFLLCSHATENKVGKHYIMLLRVGSISVSTQSKGLSLTPMYQGQTYYSKFNPYRLPSKTLGFSWMVALTACTTQQNSLVGSIPKIKFFHWSRYLSPYTISPNKILTLSTPYTYVHVMHLAFYGKTLKHTLFEIVYEEKKELCPSFRNCMTTQ